MASLSAHLQTGTLLHHGNYRIEEQIGQGGFSITYRATMVHLQKTVVIKELFFSGYSVRDQNDRTVSVQSLNEIQYKDIKDRFIQEGQVIAQFDHPNIVRVSFVFEENNTVYLVLNFIDGKSLREYVKSQGLLQLEEVKSFTGQIISALDAVHKKNILHRDIKPSNIMITSDKRAILIDFGIAKQFADNRTVSNTGAHTPGYAPLEQYSGRRKLGAFTDIYSLCATIYYSVTGQRPIDVTDRLEEELAPPIKLNPSIANSLNDLIIKGMSMKADERFASVLELQEALTKVGVRPKLKPNLSHKEKPTIVIKGNTSPKPKPTKEKDSTIKITIPKKSKTPPSTTPSKPKVIRSTKKTKVNSIKPQIKTSSPATPSKINLNLSSNAPVPPPPPPNPVKAKETVNKSIYAPFEIRLAAYFIDMLLISGFQYFIMYFLIEMEIMYYYPIFQTIIPWAIIVWLYFAIMESSRSQATFGKKILNIKVVGEDHQRISFGRATARYLGRIASAFILLIGFFMVIWDNHRQSLHDKIANTYVLKNK